MVLLILETFSSANVFKFRKVEDGCVDIYFYDWLYFGLRPLTPRFLILFPNQPNVSALPTVKGYI